MEAIVEVAWPSNNDNELTLSLGDVITNVVQVSESWYEGKLHGKQGKFREECVKIVSKDSSKLSMDNEPNVIRREERKRRTVKAIYSYTPTNDDELKLKVNDIIEVLEETEEHWWKGILKGSVGMFPASFVTEASDSSTLSGESALKSIGNKDQHIISTNISPTHLSPKQGKPKMANTTIDDETVQSLSTNKKRSSLVLKKAHQISSSSDAPLLPPKPVREQAKVLYPYEAQNDDELTLKEGDIITILSKEIEDKGWWRGELNNHVGVFPDNFVELIKTDELMQRKPERPDKPVIRPVPHKAVPNSELQEKMAAEILNTTKKPSKVPPAKPPPPEIHKKDEKPERPLLPHSIKKPQLPPPMKKPLRSSLGTTGLSPSSSVSSTFNSISSPVTDSPPPIISSSSAFTYKSTSYSSTSESSTKSSTFENSTKSSTFESSTKSSTFSESTDKKDAHDFDVVEVSTEKLMHITANRAKFPNRRPPSHIFLKENEKEIVDGIEEAVLIHEVEESQPNAKFHMKETHSKELKVCKPVPISSHEEKPKVPPYRPALPAQIKTNISKTSKLESSLVPPQPAAASHTVQALVPSSEPSASKVAKKLKEDTTVSRDSLLDTVVSKDQNTFHIELSHLRNEIKKLKESTVPKTEFECLLCEMNQLKENTEAFKNECLKEIKLLRAELEEEKRIRLTMQKEIEKRSN